MPSSDLLKARYDETPYRDPELPDFDLPRLLGLARLFGLGPRDGACDDLRVLDLACASGTHVRAQAARYPDVHFTGVDFSRNEIELGRKEIERAGSSNVELVSADLRAYEAPARQFDVVLCHGAFSWVPDEVKERLFEVVRRALKPTGVAAIAYLTYPGWKQREAIRELVAHHASKSQESQQKVRDAALVLRLLHAGYSASGESCHAQSLLDVVETMQQSSSNAFLHDELGATHDPCYFTQFVEWAGEWGLEYLCEVDLGTMSLEGLPEDAQRLLHSLAPDFIETQQLIDFLVNRSGRTSLLIPSDARVARKFSDDDLATLHFTTRLRDAVIPDPNSPSSREFFDPMARRIQIEDPTMHALACTLIDNLTAPPSYTDLERTLTTTGIPSPEIRTALRTLITRGHADPHSPL